MPKAPVTRINGAFQVQADSVGNPNNATNYNGFYAPQLTTTQRNAIPTNTLQNGAIIYNTTTSTFQVYQNLAWTNLTTGAATTLTAPNLTTANAPAAANGAIYYDTTTNLVTLANNATYASVYTSPLAQGGNLVMQSAAADPAGGVSVDAEAYYNTTSNNFRGHQNGQWGSVAIGIGAGVAQTVGVSTLAVANGISTVTVNTEYVTANSNIFLQTQGTIGTGNSGNVRVSATIANTSFTISSSNNADTSQVHWLIINP